MDVFQLANFCQSQLSNRLECYNDSRALSYTTTSDNFRQINFKIGDQEFIIEINVEERK